MRLKHPNMRPAGAPVRLRFDGAEILSVTVTLEPERRPPVPPAVLP